MGHYSDLYDQEEEEHLARREKHTTKELKELADKLSLEDKDFLIKIGRDVSDFRGFFNILANAKRMLK